MPEEDRATAIGNMCKTFGKDCMWFRRYPHGQIDRQTYSSQYFATTSVGEVKMATQVSVITKILKILKTTKSRISGTIMGTAERQRMGQIEIIPTKQ